jgi:hypothetical protein
MDRGTRLIAHFGTLSVKTLALLRLGQLGEVLRITQAGKELADENDPRPVTHSGGISQKTTVLDKPNRVHTHRSPLCAIGDIAVGNTSKIYLSLE